MGRIPLAAVGTSSAISETFTIDPASLNCPPRTSRVLLDPPLGHGECCVALGVDFVGSERTEYETETEMTDISGS